MAYTLLCDRDTRFSLPCKSARGSIPYNCEAGPTYGAVDMILFRLAHHIYNTRAALPTRFDLCKDSHPHSY